MEKIKYIDDDLEKGKLIDWNLVHKKYLKDTKPPEHVYKLDIPWDLANLFIIFSKSDHVLPIIHLPFNPNTNAYIFALLFSFS